MSFSHFRVGLLYSPPRDWTDIDVGQIREDFSQVANLGFDLVHISLPWEFLWPAPQRASQVAVGKTIALLDAAGARDLSVVISLFAGTPSYVQGRSPWADATALRAQACQLDYVTNRLKDHPAAFVWELGCAHDDAWGPPNSDEAWLWGHTVCLEFRRHSAQPIWLTLASASRLWRELASFVDVAGVALPPEIPQYTGDPGKALFPAFSCVIAATLAKMPTYAVMQPGNLLIGSLGTTPETTLRSLREVGAVALFLPCPTILKTGPLAHVALKIANFHKRRRLPLNEVKMLSEAEISELGDDRTARVSDLFEAFAKRMTAALSV